MSRVNKYSLGVTLLAALAVSVGCASGAADAPAQPGELVAAPELGQPAELPAVPAGEVAVAPAEPPPIVAEEPAAPVEQAPVAEAPPPDAVAAVAPTEAPPAPAEPVVIPGRPSEPAPIESGFRADPASVVAATGRPQLVEFFTYW